MERERKRKRAKTPGTGYLKFHPRTEKWALNYTQGSIILDVKGFNVVNARMFDKDDRLFLLMQNTINILCLQFTRTVLSSTKLVSEPTVFTRSTPTMPVPLMCTVIKLQPVGDGQCSRRDWAARLISTAAGMTTKEASEI